MKLDSIGDFIEAWRKYDSTNVSRNWNWNRRLNDSGYHQVSIKCSNVGVGNIVEWCKNKFGENHFCWTTGQGQFIFWFETEKDAMLFLLKWL